LNEKHYGVLQGMDKREMAEKFGPELVLLWRRSWDIPPEPLSKSDERHPRFDPKYNLLAEDEIPSTESLKQTIERIMPVWEDDIFISIEKYDNVFVVAHGNSLRAIVKQLKNISTENIIGLNLPTGIPYVIEFDEKLDIQNDYFIGDEEEIKKLMQLVADQTKK